MTQKLSSLGGNTPETPAEDRPRWAWGSDPLLRAYHDEEYGVTPENDEAFFEMLVLEVDPAELSWLAVLRKREAF